MPISNLQLLSSFFRIYFALNEGTLEELLPKPKKIQNNAPLPNRIKEILSDAGPIVYLLNNLIDPQFHYNPDPKVMDRTMEISSFFSNFQQIASSFPSELEFYAVVNAIVAFHKKETNYMKVFDFILANIHDNALARLAIKFLDKKVLHASCPCMQADDDADDDFSEELSDTEQDVNPRIRNHEPIPDVIAKAHDDKELMALYLASCGTIHREDLLLLYPEFLHSDINWDPVSIGPHDYVSQSLKNGYQKPDYELETYYKMSYRSTPMQIKSLPVTGANIHQEFVENREFTCLCFDPGAEKHIDHDKAIALGFLMAAAEILHDQDVDITNQYKATTSILTHDINPGIVEALRNIYDFQSEEIYESLLHIKQAHEIIGGRMKDALIKMIHNYYLDYSTVFIRLTSESVRGFPYANHVKECFDYMKSKYGETEVPNVARLDKVLQPLYEAVSSGEPKFGKISDSESLLLNRFCKYYKQFLRKFYPNEFILPVETLIDAGSDWPAIFEDIILQAVKEFGLPQYDGEEVKYQTPILNDLMAKTVIDFQNEKDEENSIVRDAVYYFRNINGYHRLDIKIFKPYEEVCVPQ